MSAAAQGAVYLTQTLLQIAEVTHTECHRNNIQQVIGYIQLLGITLIECDAVIKPLTAYLLGCHRQHILRQIDTHNSCLGDTLRQLDSQIARTRSQVHNALRLHLTHLTHHAASPNLVNRK